MHELQTWKQHIHTSVDTQKCTNMEWGQYQQVPSIKEVLECCQKKEVENIWHNKHRRNKQKRRRMAPAQGRFANRPGQFHCCSTAGHCAKPEETRLTGFPMESEPIRFPNRFCIFSRENLENAFWTFLPRIRLTPLYKQEYHGRFRISTSNCQKHNTYPLLPYFLSTLMFVTSPCEIWRRSRWPCRP
jgi:hypothetical protein